METVPVKTSIGCSEFGRRILSDQVCMHCAILLFKRDISDICSCERETFSCSYSSNMNLRHFPQLVNYKLATSFARQLKISRSNDLLPVKLPNYQITKSILPVKSELQHPPRATPRVEFLEDFCSNSPLTGPKSCSNTPNPGKITRLLF